MWRGAWDPPSPGFISCRASAGSGSALPDPSSPGPIRCRASAGIRKRHPGETAPSRPIRHGENRRVPIIHGGPRDRKEDPWWEGACPERRAFPNSCAVRCQNTNRSPCPCGCLSRPRSQVIFDQRQLIPSLLLRSSRTAYAGMAHATAILSAWRIASEAPTDAFVAPWPIRSGTGRWEGRQANLNRVWLSGFPDRVPARRQASALRAILAGPGLEAGHWSWRGLDLPPL